jgi:5-methylcytosine-specific restriction enzyme subunit McrC
MTKNRTSKLPITAFEHQSRRDLPEDVLKGLQTFYGDIGVSYYSLIHKGIKFSSYVGVLQVGDTLIEVLPKLDKHKFDESKWRDVLIDMVRTVASFSAEAPTSADLKLKPNSLLELYFELFLGEVKQLLHKGLIKKYRKVEENQKALSGAIKFSKHISANIIHRERFFVQHAVYDKQHTLNQILYKTINLISLLNTNGMLNSSIGNLLLNFPEMDDIRVCPELFERISYNRKSLAYKKAIEIARLLLLNYHPDVSGGKNNVLALMFDMNILFESYIAKKLKCVATKQGYKVKLQANKLFWRGASGGKYLRPDIIVEKGTETWILDTKWKIPKDNKPADEDLKQMYAYSHQFDGKKTYLVYPEHDSSKSVSGSFQNSLSQIKLPSDLHCTMLPVKVLDDNDCLNKKVGDLLLTEILGSYGGSL